MVKVAKVKQLEERDLRADVAIERGTALKARQLWSRRRKTHVPDDKQ